MDADKRRWGNALRAVLAMAILVCCGCTLDFGPNVSTTTPSPKHVAFCRAEMYLNPDVKIEPGGLYLVSGIDKYVQFRFVAHAESIKDVFQTDVVDTTRFATGHQLRSHTPLPWWDAPNQPLTGGEINLPNNRYLSIGYTDNGDGSLNVYAIWFET